MSLYTISFEDSTDSSDESSEIPIVCRRQVQPKTVNPKAYQPNRRIPAPRVIRDDPIPQEASIQQVSIAEQNSTKKLSKLNTTENVINKTNNYTSYHMDRNVKMTWKGHRTHFQFFQGSNALYHSKIKNMNSDKAIYISKGTICHYHELDNYAGVLLVNDDRKAFSLRSKAKYGTEIMSISFEKLNASTPRTMKVNFFGDINLPHTIKSKKPMQNQLGFWVLDFGNRRALSSVKNAVLYDADGLEHLALMKTAENVLSIDSLNNIPDLCIFAAGLASYLSKAV